METALWQEETNDSNIKKIRKSQLVRKKNGEKNDMQCWERAFVIFDKMAKEAFPERITLE